MNEEEKKKLVDEIEQLKSAMDHMKLDYDHHTHDGVNSQQVSSSGGTTSGSNFYVPLVMKWTLPQTANNFVGTEWIAPIACTVIGITETHQQSSSPNPLTLDVRKNSTSLLSSQFDLNGVGADVITTGSLTGTAANLVFAVGDRLTWAVSGSVGNIQGLCATVEFSPN